MSPGNDSQLKKKLMVSETVKIGTSSDNKLRDIEELGNAEKFRISRRKKRRMPLELNVISSRRLKYICYNCCNYMVRAALIFLE